MEIIKKKLTLTVPDLVTVLNISKSSAYQLVRRPDFPKIKIGRRIIIPTDSLQIWIKENTFYN